MPTLILCSEQIKGSVCAGQAFYTTSTGFPFSFRQESHNVALASLKVTVQPTLVWNSQTQMLLLPKSPPYPAKFIFYLFVCMCVHTRMRVCGVSVLMSAGTYGGQRASALLELEL